MVTVTVSSRIHQTPAVLRVDGTFYCFLFIAFYCTESTRRLWVDGTREGNSHKGNCEGVVFGVDGTFEGIERIRGDLL